MMKKALACTMFLGVVFSLPAAAQTPPLQFKGGIGVIPVSSVINCPASTPPAPLPPCITSTVTSPPVTVNRNIVRDVQPAGQIWVIDSLVATVGPNGSIKVNAMGLVLGGGNNAGRAPTPALSVIATLICSTAEPFTQFSSASAGVTLSPTGGFMINDTLSPLPPAACTSPMLLIRNAANLSWFAVGIYSPNG